MAPNNPQLTDFKRVIHDTILPAAWAAYDLKRVPQNWKIMEIIHGQDVLPFGFIAETPTNFIIAVRGTLTVEEWLEDLDLTPTFFSPEVIVHKGFNDQLNRLHLNYAQIGRLFARKKPVEVCKNASDLNEAATAVLRNLNNFEDEKSLIITGHSLGAVVAMLLAARLHPYCAIGGAVLFASPKPGFEAFKHFYNALEIPTVKLQNKWDIVPDAPPVELGFVSPGAKLDIDGGEPPVFLNKRERLSFAHSLDPSYKKGLEN